jgi:GT2 family glycosyltransferase
MMVPRRVFEDLGGFDEDLRVAFNDVDFCLRLRARGQLVVWTPFATLLHFESASRKALHPPEDEALMRDRWATAIADDPYYNPNLTLDHEDCRIRF